MDPAAARIAGWRSGSTEPPPVMPLERRVLPIVSRLALLPLVVAACGDSSLDTLGPPVDDRHVFSYRPPAPAPDIASISVRGSFNGWEQAPMTRQTDGSWRAAVRLADGEHRYKFFINGAWPADMCYDPVLGHPDRDYWIDPDADGCVSDGVGGQNAVIVIGEVGPGFTHDPSSPAHISIAGERLSVRFVVRAGRAESAVVTVDGERLPMHVQLGTGLHEVWRAALPESTTSYAFELETAQGTQSFGPFTVSGPLFRAVPWVGDGVGYQIFPERFRNGDPGNDHWTLETDVVNYMHPDTWDVEPVLMEEWGGEVLEFHCCHQYFGGDLQGILDRLDHLEALGVTLLYLNPIFTSGSAHGYDAFDYLEVAPNLGDESLLRQLLDAARARGIRVMWDFVPNHVGVGHGAFQEAVTDGESSPYWSWFNFNVPAGEIQVGNGNHYEAWWGFGTLPRLETRNGPTLEHLLDVVRHWTEFGFDGIRVDVPNEIRNREEFFPAFRQAAKQANPDVYLVGEIWQRDPSWLRGDQFDALMNYAIGQDVVERFARGDLNGSAAARQMASLYADYPEAATAMLFNLISSHDTGRLLTKMGGGPLGGSADAASLARHRLAAAVLYALPGIPVTFQGDECAFLGTGHGPREENRYPFQWHDCDADMMAHYRRLAELRIDLAALRSPVLRSYHGGDGVLAFHRGEPGPEELLAAFNQAPAPRSVPLPSGEWTDVATGERFSGTVPLGPLGWRYLSRN